MVISSMNVAPSSDGQSALDGALDLGGCGLAPARANVLVGTEQVDAAGAQVVALGQRTVLVDQVCTACVRADRDTQDLHGRLQAVLVLNGTGQCVTPGTFGDERGKAGAEFAQQPAGAAVRTRDRRI